ncbi:hypothetical protein CSUI_011510 [Cystoisospora suis]|uniref:Uncharacterized protein n=1 Tax=Cystoisospora suis TaxID=483139 RepID=A0A2C6JRR9_9APIC|nr:hypothetical protein CSUI_011510 [Cystoisospora suis]
MTFPKLHLIRNRICIDRCFEEIAEALGEMDHPDLELYSFASSSPSSSPRGASTTSWGRRGIQKVVV